MSSSITSAIICVCVNWCTNLLLSSETFFLLIRIVFKMNRSLSLLALIPNYFAVHFTKNVANIFLLAFGVVIYSLSSKEMHSFIILVRVC